MNISSPFFAVSLANNLRDVYCTYLHVVKNSKRIFGFLEHYSGILKVWLPINLIASCRQDLQGFLRCVGFFSMEVRLLGFQYTICQ